MAALGDPFGPNPERGVFRTSDGGETWDHVLAISDSTGAVDLAINPANPRIIFAAAWRGERKPWTATSGSEEGGIFRSTDGGDTWNRLEGGLPTGLVGKAAVTVSRANPDRVWVLIEAPNDQGGVYRSEDGGDTWRRVNSDRGLLQRAWYYTHIFADPVDENTVYALNVGYMKSVDGGVTWQGYSVPHGDVHDLWINYENPDFQVVANDGGGQVTTTGAESWSTYYNQPTAEMYRVFVDHQFPYRVYGSQQDNSTIMVPSRGMPAVQPAQHWAAVGGCESGHIAIDPRNPNVTYAGCYGGSINRVDRETGDVRQMLLYPQLQLGQAPKTMKHRFQWNAPIRISPHDHDVIYHTSQYVNRTSDAGYSWETISPDLTRNDTTKMEHAGGRITWDNTGVEMYGMIFAFEESPHEAGVLWVGSDDGLIHVSRDDGASWENVTPGRPARVLDRQHDRPLGARPGAGARRRVPLPDAGQHALHVAHGRLRGELDPALGGRDRARPLRARRARGSRAGGAPLRGHRVRVLRELRRRRQLAALSAEPADHADHGHARARGRPRHRDAGPLVLDHGRRVAAPDDVRGHAGGRRPSLRAARCGARAGRLPQRGGDSLRARRGDGGDDRPRDRGWGRRRRAGLLLEPWFVGR